jgi:hypothetical protein
MLSYVGYVATTAVANFALFSLSGFWFFFFSRSSMVRLL